MNVVLAAGILELSSVGTFLLPENYAVPLFAGLSFCVTGMDEKQRNEIGAKVQSSGGAFSRSLKKNCTHLICGDDSNSEKVEVAEKSGMYIVPLSWLTDSVSRKQLQEEGAHDALSQSGKQAV